MKFSFLSLLFLVIDGATAQDDVVYKDCDVDTYYAKVDLPSNKARWTRDKLNELVKTTHRTSLPFTNEDDAGVNDVWSALIDLDPGAEDDSVHLIFSDRDNGAIPFGVRDWIKHHLFPVTRGVGSDGVDYTDVHNIRPASPLAAEVRHDFFFGQCNVLVPEGSCVSPAEGGAEDTCVCNRLYEPPAEYRGDVARALMYMDLRYDGTDTNTLDLRLTDCPFQPETDMAYLSQMLEWHLEDPPDEAEIRRNQRTCERWQGNRNPFIDFPQLGSTIFGDPLPLPEAGRLIYEACEEIPTEAPTFSPNTCETLRPGDVYVWLLNQGENPDVGLFSFRELPGGFELYLTDNAWTGENFLDTEGTLKFTTPDTGLVSAALFGYSGSGNKAKLRLGKTWEDVGTGTFSLLETGEQIFVYCLAGDGTPKPLFGLSTTGMFNEPGKPVYGPDESALPDSLTEVGNVVLSSEYINYLYEGPNEGSGLDLRPQIMDQDNWKGSNEARFGLSGSASRQSVGLLACSFATALVGLISMLTC